MEPNRPPEPPPTESSPLENLIEGALAALDDGGEPGLAKYLERHPDSATQVHKLVAHFRAIGLLATPKASAMPERFGDFRVIESLGGGGMGVVYLAEQQSLRRTVALKVIRPGLVHFEGIRERFRREVDAIARLSHPAIVPILATGEHGGVPWYAMPLVSGCSAEEAVKRLRDREPGSLDAADLQRAILGQAGAATPLDASAFAGSYWEACVRLVRQAALGLEHAHQQGIVHRDVKPSNVMLTPDGRALLLDFGLARTRGDAQMTRPGAEPGSPAYMAPEQWRGTGADERTDVYSLAATLFQLLGLEPPFRAADHEQLRQAVLQGLRVPLRCPRLPRDLHVVLAVAMDIDRERRYRTAALFAADLGAVLERRPIQGRPLPAPVRLLRWAQRHRTAAASLAAFLVVLAAVPAAYAWQRGQALAELTAAKRLTDASLDRSLLAIREFLLRFGDGDVSRMPGGAEFGNRMLEKALALLDGIPADRQEGIREHRTYALRLRMNLLAMEGRSAEAVAAGRAALALWRDGEPLSQGIAVVMAILHTRLAEQELAQGDPTRVESGLKAADALLDRVPAEPELAATVADARAAVWAVRAKCASAQGDLPGAEAAWRGGLRALGPAQEVPEDARDSWAMLSNNLADALVKQGRAQEAAPHFAASLALLMPDGDPAGLAPDLLRLCAYARRGQGHVAVLGEDWPRAAEALRDGLRLYEGNLAAYPADPESMVLTAMTLTELAQVVQQLGEPVPGALAMLERAHRLFGRARGYTQRDREARIARLLHSRVYGGLLVEQHDAAGLLQFAGALAGAAHDPDTLAGAAWHLLKAADLADRNGDAATADAAAARALQALQDCDAAGWFPPVDLEAPECRFLIGRAGFRELLARHPSSAATRHRAPGR